VYGATIERVRATGSATGLLKPGRVVRPEPGGLAVVIELFPRRQRVEAPLVVPDPPRPSC